MQRSGETGCDLDTGAPDAMTETDGIDAARTRPDDATAPAALVLDGVTCRFPARRRSGSPYVAIRDVDLAVGHGEFVSIVGPTGCGKSTLLNVAAGLLRPTEGRATAFGASLDGPNRKAGYLFQADALFPWATALDNVTAGLRYRGTDAAEARARGEDWLKRTGLDGFGGYYPHQ